MMKKMCLFLLLGSVLAMVSCKKESMETNDSDQNVALANLPTTVTDWITQNYAGYTTVEAENETLCDGTTALEVAIRNGATEVDLYFDANGLYLFEETPIVTANLPAAILNAIATNYPDYLTEDLAAILTLADDTLQYEVELEKNATNTEVSVIFDAAGGVICERAE